MKNLRWKNFCPTALDRIIWPDIFEEVNFHENV